MVFILSLTICLTCYAGQAVEGWEVESPLNTINTSEVEKDAKGIQMVDSTRVASSIIYEDSGKVTDGYLGKTITVPSSGTYNVFYCVTSLSSDAKWYSFIVNDKLVNSGNATGESCVYKINCSAGGTIAFGLNTIYGGEYYYSIFISK